MHLLFFALFIPVVLYFLFEESLVAYASSCLLTFAKWQNPKILEIDASFSQALALADSASESYALCLGLVFPLLFYASYRFLPLNRFTRRLSMRDLVVHNAKMHSQLLPILRWGRSILDEPLDEGPWMTARQPLQFVAMHGLLRSKKTKECLDTKLLLASSGLADPHSPVLTRAVHAYLDTDKTRDIFCEQCGPEFYGFSSMPNYCQVLALAFCFFGLGSKEKAYVLLKGLNEGFLGPVKQSFFSSLFRSKSKEEDCGFSLRVPKLRDEDIALFESAEIQKVCQAHSQYMYCLLLALYSFARQKGVLCTSEFIWLRVVDRVLFYLLNNYGRRTVWVECAGPWVHFQAEEVLFRKGLWIPDSEKLVDEAVRALTRTLVEEGWIDPE